MNKFEELVEDLVSGRISFNLIQMAMREYVRRSKNIPVECKDILAGKGDTNAGLIYRQFKLIEEVIGGMELAVRRAKDK